MPLMPPSAIAGELHEVMSENLAAIASTRKQNHARHFQSLRKKKAARLKKPRRLDFSAIEP
jgi:hypothetical protein